MSLKFYSKSENTDNCPCEIFCHEEKAQWHCLPDPELFEGLSAEDAENWKAYLYTKPKKQGQRFNLRSHAVALYDPFAARKDFAAGRRWCVNVYVGCAHSCRYCYIAAYIRKPFEPRPKKNFEKLLQKDFKEIEKLNLHPAPVHISNSTDPFQPIEKIHRHTLFLLREIQANRKCFTTITMLTKNPAMLCESEYLNIIQQLENFQVEVTCPFYRDEIRKYFEPGAPTVESRLKAIEELRENNITVSLRIDPIFPREPLPEQFFRKPLLEDYGAPESHTEEDIEQLIQFAAKVRCKRIIVSPLKLVMGRFAGKDLRPDYLRLYSEANQGKAIKKGSSYRLSWALYRHWVEKPRQIGMSLGIPVIYCKNNLLKTD